MILGVKWTTDANENQRLMRNVIRYNDSKGRHTVVSRAWCAAKLGLGTLELRVAFALLHGFRLQDSTWRPGVCRYSVRQIAQAKRP